MAHDEITGCKIAIKAIPKCKAKMKYVTGELAALQKVKYCEGIVQLFDAMEDNDSYVFVCDYIKGKDLLTLLLEKQTPFEENEAREMFTYIANSVKTLHKLNIVHHGRDPSFV